MGGSVSTGVYGGNVLEGGAAVRIHPLVPLVFALLVLACSDRGADQGSTMRSRPVTVLELSERDFPRERALTGSVNLYREEQIGFEVTGRVLSVLDQGREVRGPAFNEDGEMVRRGDRIASMESTRS